nr:organ-specific protein P4-like [Ipomoea batatas]
MKSKETGIHLSMKPFTAFYFLFTLLLINYCFSTDARMIPAEEYWKRKMNGEAMPRVISDLTRNQDSSFKVAFVGNFNAKPNSAGIIYHANAQDDVSPKKQEKRNERPNP